MNTSRTSRSDPARWRLALLLALAFAPPASSAGQANDEPCEGEVPPAPFLVGQGESLRPFYSITGRVSCSVDAGGSNYGVHAIQVRKPNAAATVNRAFLLAATIPAGGVIPDGGVRLNGAWVAWDAECEGPFNLNFLADVTAIVKPVVDAAAPGNVNFMVTEPWDTSKVDGEVLVVVFNDPAYADDRTVALLFGSQALTGDTFTISLAEPIDPNEPGAAADMGLAISWSTGGTQRSFIDVQGIRMSSSAGGYDDGYFANGAFITGGGLGDSLENPPDPNASGDSGYDDELYSLLPFIDETTTEITVFTVNPSYDDNIFFAYFYFSTAAIVSQAVMLTPLTAENEVGTDHTVTAMVQDFFGNPVISTPVTFEVIAGPNQGDSGVVDTDQQGSASWTYTGDGGAGTDQIQAWFVDAVGDEIYSNVVTNDWFVVNQPPVSDAGGPYGGWINVPVQLDGSGSWDPDDDIVAYEWDCDDDGAYDDAAGVSPTWTFGQPGTYTVGLLVRDSVGHEDEDDATVEVGNHAPVADPGGPYEGPPSGSITLDGTASYDPDPGDTITYAWDLDDDGWYDDSTAPQPQFVIGDVPPGTVYTVRLRVTDQFDSFHSASTTVTVTNRAPICDAGGPYTGECAGATTSIQLDGNDSYDVDPGDALRFSWSSDCPGASLDDPNAVEPVLTLDSDCSVECTVFLTVTDLNEASSDCSATVSVADTTPPEFTNPPADAAFECDGNGNADDIQAWLDSAAASDTCGDVTLSNDYQGLSDDCGATGSATVTWTATDACGLETTHTAMVSVVDTTSPTITTPAGDQTVECDGAGNVAELDAWLNSHGGAAATDVCGDVTWSHDFSGLSDGCGAAGSATVTFTATDDCGQTATTTATFTIADTVGPSFSLAPDDATFECDGQGNLAGIQPWLDSAAATDVCGDVNITHDFAGLSDGCGTTGSATVTWTVTDECGNPATHTATVTVVDTTPPDIECPPDVFFEHDVPEAEVLAWLNSATATDVCDANEPTITHDAPQGGFPPGSTTVVTWTATDACGVGASCSATIEIGSLGRVTTSEKGSLLLFPKVELRWDADGNLIQDTFVSLTNDYSADVWVYVALVSETCTRLINDIVLTRNEPAYWAASTGLPKGLAPFTALGQPYPDPEGSAERVLRGYIVAWAINPDCEQIRWNHLSGTATIVDYSHRIAWEYSPYAFKALRGENGEVAGTPGTIELNGTVYDYAYNKLLLDFLAVGASSFSGGGRTITHDTDLTLVIVDMDLRQDTQGPYAVKAEFEVWNQNEVSFAGNAYCLTKWDESLLSSAGGHFLLENLQTDRGRARIDGLSSWLCPDSGDHALAGVAAKVLSFDGGPSIPRAGRSLVGSGMEDTDILYDVPEPGKRGTSRP
jgi:hypothetical protein